MELCRHNRAAPRGIEIVLIDMPSRISLSCAKLVYESSKCLESQGIQISLRDLRDDKAVPYGQLHFYSCRGKYQLAVNSAFSSSAYVRILECGDHVRRSGMDEDEQR